MAGPAPSNRRWAIRLGIVLGLCVLLTVGYRLRPQTALPVRAVSAVVGQVRDVVTSSVAGEIAPERHAAIRAELAARVVERPHERGDRVKAGEVLVRLDAADLDARLAQAQAAAQAMVGQLSQAQARLTTVRRQAERARTLLSRGAGTAQASEDADAAVKEAIEAVTVAAGQVRQSQAAERVARVARTHAEITAPFAGLLTEVSANLGEALTPGSPVVEIMDDSRLHVDATIDEADAAKVRTGQEATLRLDALPERSIAGRVTKVDPAVKRDVKGERTLAVEVAVQDVGQALAQGLKPGMSANVEIVVAQKDAVLSLPSNVIIGRGLNRSVFLLLPEGRRYRARKQPIQVGLSNWERTEITHGVAAGDLVAASLNDKALEDGVLVEVQKDKPVEGGQ